MLANKGEITPPWGEPVVGYVTAPSCQTPAFSHLPISRSSMRCPPIRCSRNRIIQSWLMRVEERPDVGVEDPVHRPPGDPEGERIQRIMLGAPRSEPVGEAEEAAHNGPESCGVAREGGVEALTGETAGWVLSRVMLNVRGADAVEKSGRQHGGHRHGEVHAGPARSEAPMHAGAHHPHGNREVPGLPGAGGAGPQRQGHGRNPLMHGPGSQTPPHSTPRKRPNKPGRPGAEAVEGRGGAKGTAGRQSTGRDFRAGKPCHRRWPAYEKRRSGTGMNGSPR